MKDLYLKADTQDIVFAALTDAGLLQNIAGTPMPTQLAAVDVIGEIYGPSTTADDGTVTPGSLLPGYLCNVRIFNETPEIENALAAITLDPPPATPVRTFWG
jgi:hypothetical protein